MLKQALFLAWAELPLASDPLANARGGSDGESEGMRAYASARNLSVNVSDMLLHFCARPDFVLPGAAPEPLAQLPALQGTMPQVSSGLHLACLLVGGASSGAGGSLLAEPKLNAAQLQRVFQVSAALLAVSVPLHHRLTVLLLLLLLPSFSLSSAAGRRVRSRGLRGRVWHVAQWLAHLLGYVPGGDGQGGEPRWHHALNVAYVAAPDVPPAGRGHGDDGRPVIVCCATNTVNW